MSKEDVEDRQLTRSNLCEDLVVDTNSLEYANAIFIESDATRVGRYLFFSFQHHIRHLGSSKES